MTPLRILLGLGCVVLVKSDSDISHHFFPEQDKFATDDPFYELAPAGNIKGYTVPINLTEAIDAIDQPSIISYIEVVLLGMNWETGAGPILEASDLGRFLDSFDWDREVRVAMNDYRALHMKRKAMFSVKRSSKELENNLMGVLNRAFSSGQHEISYSLVDNVLKTDYLSSSASSYRIYLFSFPYLTTLDKQMYYYNLESGKGCGNSMWIAKNRYIWIDLNAGPVTIVQKCDSTSTLPRLIDDTTLPRMDRYGEKENFRRVEFFSVVAALLYKVAEEVIFPSLHALRPYSDSRHLTIHLFVITDNHEEAGFGQVDWQKIRSLIGGLSLFGQKMLYKMEKMSFFSCSHCVAAYSHALKTQLAKHDTRKSSVTLTNYLDSKELHYWLQKFRSEFEVKNVPIDDLSAFETHNAVPVYLFSLQSFESLLLDGNKQAVAFDDMVIAVQTKKLEYPCATSCVNGKFQMASGDMTRPIAAALLTTLYGILPSHFVMRHHVNKTESFPLWSTGLTPFGYLSDSLELSFSLTDAIFRAPVLSNIEKYLSMVTNAMKHYASFGVDVCSALSLLDCTELAMRWQLFLYKIDKASSLLSVGNYGHALFFSRSLKHDADSIRGLLLEAERNTYPRLGCDGVPLRLRSIYGAVVLPVSSFLLLALLSCLTYAAIRLGGGLREKRPQTKPKQL
ncbi:uncharacterized protein [Oscarella lobularis]|uniref:uncharacterized protein n=1 Tax=Oscarella lobularis TaxID=121494 RepID=UPI0033131776